MDKDLQIVGFQVGRETYGVAITAVHEIVRVPEITALPEAPSYVEGVINLRGKIVPVIDLRKRFGEAAAQRSNKNRILVAEVKGKLLGLIVDSASEVLRVPRSEIEAPPALLHEGGMNCVVGVAKGKARLIILIDLERLAQPADSQRERQPQPAAATAGPATMRAQAGGK